MLPENYAITTCPFGAGKWKDPFSAFLEGKRVIIIPDQDQAGRQHADQVEASLRGHAKEIFRLDLPEGKDLSQWVEKTHPTQESFLKLLESRIPYQGNANRFESLQIQNAADFVQHNPDSTTQWIWGNFIARSTLNLLVGRPKLGKTTLEFALIKALLEGTTFLGHDTQPTKILLLALEENRSLVRQRLHDLGLDTHTDLFIRIGLIGRSKEFCTELHDFLVEHDIGLVCIDTLSQFWSVKDENASAETNAALKPLRELAHHTKCAILLIHHSRKTDGNFGDEVRGSSAILGAVDVAIILKGGDTPTQRRIITQSRYSETPSELVIDFRDGAYIAMGSDTQAAKEARLDQICEALREEFEPIKTIVGRTSLKYGAVRNLLNTLLKAGRILRKGKGAKNSPFLFARRP